MLGDIDSRSAIFAAECESLQNAQTYDDYRSRQADARCAGDEPDTGSGNPHQGDSHKEGVFAPQPVAKKAEQDRTKGAKTEADCKSCPYEQDFECLVVAREEGRADQCGKRAVNEEVVPFEDRTGAARSYDKADFLVRGLPVNRRHSLDHLALPPPRIFFASGS